MIRVWNNCRPPGTAAAFFIAAAATAHDVLGCFEIVGRAVVAVGKLEIAVENEIRVVKLVHDHRSVSLRQGQCRFASVVDEPMGSVQWNTEKISLPPAEALRLSVWRRYFSRSGSRKNVVDFLVHVALGVERAAGRNLHHIQSRDVLLPIELNKTALASEPLPGAALRLAHVGNVPSLHNGDAFALDKSVVAGFVRRLGSAHIDHKISLLWTMPALAWR